MRRRIVRLRRSMLVSAWCAERRSRRRLRNTEHRREILLAKTARGGSDPRFAMTGLALAIPFAVLESGRVVELRRLKEVAANFGALKRQRGCRTPKALKTRLALVT